MAGCLADKQYVGTFNLLWDILLLEHKINTLLDLFRWRLFNCDSHATTNRKMDDLLPSSSVVSRWAVGGGGLVGMDAAHCRLFLGASSNALVVATLLLLSREQKKGGPATSPVCDYVMNHFTCMRTAACSIGERQINYLSYQCKQNGNEERFGGGEAPKRRCLSFPSFFFFRSSNFTLFHRPDVEEEATVTLTKIKFPANWLRCGASVCPSVAGPTLSARQEG